MSTAQASSRVSLLAAFEELDLISAEALSELRDTPGLRSEEMLAALVEAGHLTRFQAQALARGLGAQLVVNDYLLMESVGAGATGTVYKARHRETREMVALKLVPRRNVVNLASLAVRIEAMKQIRHPRVSAMIDVGTIREWAYTVYPYLDAGQKLDAVVRKQGRIAPRQAVQVAVQIASGLQSYHAHGLFHGLLKPNEVVVGTDRRVRLLDFGVGFLLACERGKSLLSTTTNGKAIARGLDCASPESILNPLDRTPAGDQYSLGCILYYCLAGRFPFPDDNPVKKMLGHQFHEPTPIRELVPELPERLEGILSRMLAKRPEDRYAGMEELIEELQALTTDPRALPTVVSRTQPADPVRPSSRHAELVAEARSAAERPAAPTRGLPLWVPVAIAVTAGIGAAVGFGLVWRG